ncbi:hypothetical protein U91I_01738 [alpha proteobacterium U9-1i]|nr:hypothetical protein U91I_01738 [alpha proteobacterium U9-1i]
MAQEGRMLKRAFGLACLVLSACATAPEPGAAAHWQALTRMDVDAAYQQLLEDHPATSRTLNDTEFRARLDAGHTLALRRAVQVTNFDGYAATLSGLAWSVGDKHVYSRPLVQSDAVQWAGIVIGRRGEHYVVVEHEAGSAPSLVGARLLSCDGVLVDTFARDKLGGFRAVWSIEAQRIQTAPFLLIDDGNPFVLRPDACVFERNGETMETPLSWRRITRADLRPRALRAANRGAAGYGVRPFSGGLWIALQGLQSDAPAVVAAARAQTEQLRAAPIVVLDMRGNSGGSSSYGRELARIVFGDARVEAMLEADGDDTCSSLWRASPRNLARARQYIEILNLGPQAMADLRQQAEETAAALAAGQDFEGDPFCGDAGEPSTPASPPPADARGRVVVLTDNACFSSCLLVTDDFRTLGALHVGQSTDANTHYSEVREDRLPSGLSMFSTLQAMMPSAPPQIGPFEPALRYDGDMSDSTALEAWVAEVAAR